MASENVLILNANNFETEVLCSKVPILVDFWAAWCGPCKMVAPVLDELATEYGDKAKIGKVDVDDQATLASKYSIMSIPTLILFKDGQIVKQLSGARPKAELKSFIDSAL